MTGEVFALHSIRPCLEAQQQFVSEKEIIKLHCRENRNIITGHKVNCGKFNHIPDSPDIVSEKWQFELGRREVQADAERLAGCDSPHLENGSDVPKRHKSA